jgi:hypothetical protein
MTNFTTVHLGNNVLAVVLGEEPIKILGPFIEGATRPAWVITVLFSDNTPLNLTGATFASAFYDPRTATLKDTSLGAYAITTAASGIFTYTPVAADTDTPGVWWWQTTITIAGAVYIIRMPVVIEENLFT